MVELIERFIELVAWGGCSALPASMPPYPYSIVCHNHRDHIPRDENITLITPRPVGRRNTIVISERSPATIRAGKITARIFALGRKTMMTMGIEARIHGGAVTPLLIVVDSDAALYIDDFDVEDVDTIKLLVSKLRESARFTLTTVILPVYSGAVAHGAAKPEQLAEASKELIAHFLLAGLKVVALAHPVIPQWIPQGVKKLYKFVPTVR